MVLLEGALTALITPLTDDDRVDFASLKRVARQQIDGGIQGIVVLGTTGEASTLTPEEQQRVVETVLEEAKGKIPVICGTGSNATKVTASQNKRAMAWGADAALVVCPYYNKPTQEGLFRHFKAVFEETGAPIVAYNVPSRTVSDLLPETIGRLVEAGAIVGLKDATANMERAIQTFAAVHAAKKPCALLSGDDFTILPFIACGGTGVISVVSNPAPSQTVELVALCRRGDLASARPLQARLNELSRALFAVSSPIPVKAAMAMLGLCTPAMRLPLVAADEKTQQAVKAAMEAFGLFGARGPRS
jgi:4-hydroxy-tetrahydrodipicolinate synthase